MTKREWAAPDSRHDPVLSRQARTRSGLLAQPWSPALPSSFSKGIVSLKQKL